MPLREVCRFVWAPVIWGHQSSLLISAGPGLRAPRASLGTLFSSRELSHVRIRPSGTKRRNVAVAYRAFVAAGQHRRVRTEVGVLRLNGRVEA